MPMRTNRPSIFATCGNVIIEQWKFSWDRIMLLLSIKHVAILHGLPWGGWVFHCWTTNVGNQQETRMMKCLICGRHFPVACSAQPCTLRFAFTVDYRIVAISVPMMWFNSLKVKQFILHKYSIMQMSGFLHILGSQITLHLLQHRSTFNLRHLKALSV